MKQRSVALLWILAVMVLLVVASFFGVDGALQTAIVGMAGIVIGYYFGREEDVPAVSP